MSIGLVLLKQHELVDTTRVVFKMNHEDGGFDRPGCARPDDRHGLSMDICENGIKHATWDLTKKKADPDFFAAHTVAELSTWSDFALEDVGRLTDPRRYDSASDKYVPVSWDYAFVLVGCLLLGLANPDEAAFYTSGRLSNEATLSSWASTPPRRSEAWTTFSGRRPSVGALRASVESTEAGLRRVPLRALERIGDIHAAVGKPRISRRAESRAHRAKGAPPGANPCGAPGRMDLKRTAWNPAPGGATDTGPTWTRRQSAGRSRSQTGAGRWPSASVRRPAAALPRPAPDDSAPGLASLASLDLTHLTELGPREDPGRCTDPPARTRSGSTTGSPSRS
jgi:hypothetical protein